MIEVTKLNGEELHVAAMQIETVQALPDTLVTLVSGRQLYVRETVAEVEAAILAWFRAVHARERA